MQRSINPLLFFLTTASRTNLVRQIEFLRLENQILRSKLPRCIPITLRERRRLITYGRRVGTALRHLLTIVSAHTFDRWLRGHTWRKGTRPRHPGRPRTPRQLERIVLRIARDTGWGYTRILGELKKLGVRSISRTTVINILKRAGLDPSPERSIGTWDQFIRRHAKTLWACDFLPRKVLTFQGWRDAYILVFINIKSRRTWVSPATLHPTRAWTAGQVIALCERHAADPNAPRLVLRDRDSKFTGPFDAALKARKISVIKTRHCSPNMNAYAERFIQTLQQECLDHFMICGLKHFDHLVREFLEHYHTERPHQGVGNVILRRAGPAGKLGPAPPSSNGSGDQGRVLCRQRLGGLLRHFYRSAA